jgi:hypothetical protein
LAALSGEQPRLLARGSSRAVWLGWVSGSTVGWGATSEQEAGLLLPLLGLAVLLLGQWLILRRFISRAGWWPLLSTVGLLAGTLLGSELGDQVERLASNLLLALPESVVSADASLRLSSLLGPAVAGACLGDGLGLCQWLLLRGQLPGAGWWPLASTLGFALGAAVGAASPIAGGAITGAISGLATGNTLIWLLTRSGLLTSEVNEGRAPFRPR